MTLSSARRYLPLIAAVASFATMWVFAEHPLVWKWMGRPNEVYPEFIFLIFGLPAGIVAVASGLWIACAPHRSGGRPRSTKIAQVINTLAVAICAGLMAFALWAFLNRA